MELAEELEARNCELQLQWVRRDLNQLADDLTNEKFDHFSPDFRVPLVGKELRWRVLGKLLEHAGSYFSEVKKRKAASSVKPMRFRKKPKELDPW